MNIEIQLHGLLFSAEGKVLLLKSTTDAWQLPGGIAEFGEPPEPALVRILREPKNAISANASSGPASLSTAKVAPAAPWSRSDRSDADA